jgi:hypothetical protein
MGQTPMKTRMSLPPGAIVAGIGGLLALFGVFLDWANLTSSLQGGQFAGQQIPAASQSVGASGTSHWTGILALLAAVVALVAAAGIWALRDPATRRTAAMAATGAGAVALLMAVMAFFMTESIALADVPGGREALDFARQFAEQLGVQGFGIETSAAIGVFVTAVGGAVAAVGGFLALRGAEAQPEEPLSPESPPPGTGFEMPTTPSGETKQPGDTTT